MRILLVLLAGMILFFGCVGGETPPANQTNETGKVNQTGIKIIVGEQKNQSTLKNETPPPPPPPPPEETEMNYTYEPEAMSGIFFIDVGGPEMHGDAILVKKGDCDVLLDAGSSEKGGAVTDFLNSRAVDDIEVLISTNADPRHYGGISNVADNFRIEEFWWSGESFGDPDYSALVMRMENETITVRKVADGFSTDLNGMNFTILNPPIQDRFEDVNNDAIVTRLTDRNFSILFTSSIQTGAQGLLINQKKEQIKVPLMQAPYFGVGAGTSNIGIFLLTAGPDVMVISGSSDESAVNGGSREPFKRLMAQYNITYYENYANGTIRVATDGSAYSVQALGLPGGEEE